MTLIHSLKRVRRLAMAGQREWSSQMQLQTGFSRCWQQTASIAGATVVRSGKPLAPGLTFWLDEEQGKQEISCAHARGGGINVKTRVSAAGRWMGLHIGLGEIDISDLAVLGIYSQQRAARSCTWRLCLRSGTEDGFVDHFFDKHVVAYAAPATHVDTLELSLQKGLPRRAAWREIVLFFYPESFDVTIQDLRLFCV